MGMLRGDKRQPTCQEILNQRAAAFRCAVLQQLKEQFHLTLTSDITFGYLPPYEDPISGVCIRFYGRLLRSAYPDQDPDQVLINLRSRFCSITTNYGMVVTNPENPLGNYPESNGSLHEEMIHPCGDDIIIIKLQAETWGPDPDNE